MCQKLKELGSVVSEAIKRIESNEDKRNDLIDMIRKESSVSYTKNDHVTNLTILKSNVDSLGSVWNTCVYFPHFATFELYNDSLPGYGEWSEPVYTWGLTSFESYSDFEARIFTCSSIGKYIVALLDGEIREYQVEKGYIAWREPMFLVKIADTKVLEEKKCSKKEIEKSLEKYYEEKPYPVVKVIEMVSKMELDFRVIKSITPFGSESKPSFQWVDGTEDSLVDTMEDRWADDEKIEDWLENSKEIEETD